MSVDKQRVAVIGAGVAGLTAGYLLQRRYDVTLFEAEYRLGGHAHTHDVVTPDAGALAIDSGFIVHNRRTYPQLLRLFDELDVPTQPTEMSMSVRCDGCALEYAGARGIGGLFAQRRSWHNGQFLRMLTQINRFHRQAREVLNGTDDRLTLDEFIRAGNYIPYFASHFLVPVVSAVWSAAPRMALRYPARYLFTFLDHHGMLNTSRSSEWRTVVGGSRVYVERAVKHLTRVELSTPVRSIVRGVDAVEVRDEADQVHRFDRAVIATHADTALSLLTDATSEERDVLGAFGYSHNEAILHTDETVLPRAARARAAWNYLLPACAATTAQVVVSYDMNRLQHLPSATTHVVSLNPGSRVQAGSAVARMRYDHPIYTRRSVAAQGRLAGLNSSLLAFAGAYHGWGFHEDGCRSGSHAAASFGVSW